MECWSDGVLECWSGGVLEWWSGGVVEWWSGGVVEWWSGGVVEWWSGGAGGAVERWSGGAVERWSDRSEGVRDFSAGDFQKVPPGSLHQKAPEDSAQGFNPGRPRVSTLGTPQNRRFALKGARAYRVNLAPIAAQKSGCAVEALLCYSRFLASLLSGLQPALLEAESFLLCRLNQPPKNQSL